MSLLVVGSVALDSVETPTEGGKTCWAGRPCSSPMPPASSPPCGWPAWSARIGRPSIPRCSQARGIDTAGLQVVPGGKTFRWRGKYLPNMNDRETLDLQLNVLGNLRSRAAGRAIAAASSCFWPTARRLAA